MGKIIRLYVDDSLQQVFERIRKEVAEEFKKKYKLNSITVSGTLTSQIIAAKINNKNYLHFEIEKVGLNKGILRIV